MSGIIDYGAASSRRGPSSLDPERRATTSTLRVPTMAAAASSSTSAPPASPVLRTIAAGVVDPSVSDSVSALVVISVADADGIVDHSVPVRDGDGDDGDRRRAESDNDDDGRTVAVLVRVRDSVGGRFATRRVSCRARDSVFAGTSISTADSSDERTCRCGVLDLRHFRPRFRGPCRSIARSNGASMSHQGLFNKSSFATGAPNPPSVPGIASRDDPPRWSGSSLHPLENAPAQSPLWLNPLFPLGNRSEYGFLLSISSPTAPRRCLSHTERTFGALNCKCANALHRRAPLRQGMTHCCRKDMPPIGVTPYAADIRGIPLNSWDFRNPRSSLTSEWDAVCSRRNAAHCGRNTRWLSSNAHIGTHLADPDPVRPVYLAPVGQVKRALEYPLFVQSRIGIHRWIQLPGDRGQQVFHYQVDHL